MIIKKVLKRFYPLIFILIISLIYYLPYFQKNLLPIPADIITGMYYPWLDQKFKDYPTGVPVKNYLPSDVVSLTYPLRLTSINLLKNDVLPFINLHILSGVPLLSNFQSAVTNPLNFIYFIIPDFAQSWSLQVILQLILAFIGMYLFLRSANLSLFSSLSSSIIFAGGGFFSIWSQYNTVFHAALSLPFILFGINKLNTNRLYGLLITFFTFYSINSGNPPITIIVILTVMLFLITQNYLRLKSYLFPIIFLAFGFLFSAPLLLPGFQTSSASIRDFDNVALINNIKQSDLKHLVTLVVPDFFGNPSTLNQWPNSGLYDNLTIFQGSVAILLFFCFLLFCLKIKSKLHQFIIISTVISLLLIFSNPLTNWITNQSILGLSSLVFTRFHLVLNFSISIAVAIFLDHIVISKKQSIKILPVFIIFLLLNILIITIPLVLYYSNLTGIKIFPIILSNQFIFVTLRNLILPLALMFFTLITIIFIKILPKYKIIFLSFLILLMFFDYYRFFTKYNSFTPAKFLYPSNPITTFLKSNSQRFVRDSGPIIPSNMWQPYGLSNITGYDTLQSISYNQFLSFIDNRSLTNISSRFPEVENLQSPLINFLGVDHLVTLKWDSIMKVSQNGRIRDYFKSGRYQKVFESGSVAVLKNPDAFPLFFAIKQLEQLRDIPSIETFLKTKDLKTSAVIDQNISLLSYPGNITINKPEKLLQGYRFVYSSDDTAFIVTSHAYDPNWQVIIDKQNIPIIKTNYAFIGFQVPKGFHQVTFIYKPYLFYLGLKIALISLLVFLILLIYLTRHPHNVSQT